MHTITYADISSINDWRDARDWMRALRQKHGAIALHLKEHELGRSGHVPFSREFALLSEEVAVINDAGEVIRYLKKR
jgi:hypothetical protein